MAFLIHIDKYPSEYVIRSKQKPKLNCSKWFKISAELLSFYLHSFTSHVIITAWGMKNIL